jgi:hypothetical protein
MHISDGKNKNKIDLRFNKIKINKMGQILKSKQFFLSKIKNITATSL